MPDASLYPFEFLIPGTPVSMQSRNRPRLHAYKADVQALARATQMKTFPAGPTDDVPVAATIYYFSADAISGDVDNIVKPILDSLRTVAFNDDGLIERVVVQKIEPEKYVAFEAPTEQLSAAIDAAAPVVYVRIDDDLSWRTVG